MKRSLRKCFIFLRLAGLWESIHLSSIEKIYKNLVRESISHPFWQYSWFEEVGRDLDVKFPHILRSVVAATQWELLTKPGVGYLWNKGHCFSAPFPLVTLIKLNNRHVQKNEMQLAVSPILYISQFLKGFWKSKNFKVTFCDPGTALWGFVPHSHEILRAHKSNTPISFPLMSHTAWSGVRQVQVSREVWNRKWPWSSGRYWGCVLGPA